MTVLPGRPRVSVFEAATALGIKPVSVKLRLLRGTLRGGKTWSRQKGLCWTWVDREDLAKDLRRRGRMVSYTLEDPPPHRSRPRTPRCPTCGAIVRPGGP